MVDSKQALRDQLMSRYLKKVHQDMQGSNFAEIFDMMENDFIAFSQHKVDEDVPKTRRDELKAYAERAYIDGGETWDKFTQLYLDDANRCLQLASDIIRKMK